MSDPGYKILGFVVWRGMRWYLRRNYGRLIPSRRVTAAGLVAVTVTGLVLAGRRDAVRPGS